MLNTHDFIETNGASLTVDIKNIDLTGEEAKKKIKELIAKMELEDKGLILSHSALISRITIRVKGDSKKIEELHNAISKDSNYCVMRKISLAY